MPGPGGRPPIHTDPNEVDRLVNEYFAEIKANSDHPTVTGLTLHLGFCNKSSLYDYANKPKFSNSIKRGLTKIEQAHEKALFSNGCTGNIFALKNMGWADKQEIKHEGGFQVSIPITKSDFDSDDIK